MRADVSRDVLLLVVVCWYAATSVLLQLLVCARVYLCVLCA